MKQFVQRWWVFVAAPMVLVLLLVPKFIGMAAGEGAAGGARERAAPAVRVETVESRTVRETLVLNGDLIAIDAVDIRPEISGRVVEIGFTDGGEVRAGQLLVKIRDDELQAQRRSVLRDLELARLQERRQERLLESRSTSVETFDEARLRREKLEAELDLIDARLAETEIRAPFDGRIGFSGVSVGAMVESSTRITSLQSGGLLEVEFAVPERYLGALATGLSVRVRAEGQDQVYTGEIFAIEPRVDPGTRTIACRARIDNREGDLLPGGFARVELELATMRNALLVPAIAVIAQIDHATVYVLEDGKAVLRRVVTGRRSGSQVQILEGLQAGEQVIVAGIQSLRPGAPVRVLEPVFGEGAAQ